MHKTYLTRPVRVVARCCSEISDAGIHSKIQNIKWFTIELYPCTDSNSNQIFHLRQRVSSWVFLHLIRQYDIPQTIHLYLPKSPQTTQSFRAGFVEFGAFILKEIIWFNKNDYRFISIYGWVASVFTYWESWFSMVFLTWIIEEIWMHSPWPRVWIWSDHIFTYVW